MSSRVAASTNGAHQLSTAMTRGSSGIAATVVQRRYSRIKVADSAGSNLEPIHIVLAGEEGLEVVGEAADIETALHRTRELRPQVVVLDLNMPGTPTLSAMDRFTALAPMSAVVVLTM